MAVFVRSDDTTSQQPKPHPSFCIDTRGMDLFKFPLTVEERHKDWFKAEINPKRDSFQFTHRDFYLNYQSANESKGSTLSDLRCPKELQPLVSWVEVQIKGVDRATKHSRSTYDFRLKIDDVRWRSEPCFRGEMEFLLKKHNALFKGLGRPDTVTVNWELDSAGRDRSNSYLRLTFGWKK